MTSSPTAFRATGETWTLADHPTANDIKLAYIHNILSLAGDVNAGRMTVLLISYLLSVAVAEVARVGHYFIYFILRINNDDYVVAHHIFHHLQNYHLKDFACIL